MSNGVRIRIGELLTREGLITSAQLEQALEAKKRQDDYKPLGDVCVELGFLSPAELNQVLNKHKKRIQIGDLLVNKGIITQEQLGEALIVQKSSKKKLGEILLEMELVSEADLLRTLSVQIGFPQIIPDFDLIDETLLKKINEDFLIKNEVLPAFMQENVLTVIMSNPLDEDTIRQLSQIFQCRVDPGIALSKDIKNAITEHFHPQEKPASRTKSSKDLIIKGDDEFSLKDHDNVISILNYLLTAAIKADASDIHIEPKEKNLRIRFRIDGILQHITDLPLSVAQKLISRIKVLCGVDIAEKRRHQDGRIETEVNGKDVDLRVSIYASIYGENVVIRILHRSSELIELDALGFCPANREKFQKSLENPSGIILTTGPTGSGKTTTLYASLNTLNDGEKAIITVEDPVEYTMEGVVQGQLDHKIGHTYVDFLKSMMRQDPDIIMLGEIRDVPAAEAAIQAALTGHKVLSTFHADDTTGAILRLIDMGIDTFLIATTMDAVVSQRLVRTLCVKCREPYVPNERDIAGFHIHSFRPDQCTFFRPAGCAQCGNSGFRGRTAIHEMLTMNDRIRDAILKNKSSAEIRVIARYSGDMITMREDGFYKASLGITSLNEVLRLVTMNDSEEMAPDSVREIIDLCEGITRDGTKENLREYPEDKKTPGTSRPEVEGIQAPIAVTPPPAASPDQEPVGNEEETYRMRFDVTSIEKQTEKMVDFFHAFQESMEMIGKPLQEDLLKDFSTFIIYTAKRLQMSLKAEFAEYCIKVQENDVKILLETLVPQQRPIQPVSQRKTDPRRLINFVSPSSDGRRTGSSDNGLPNIGRSGRKKTAFLELLKSENTTPSSWTPRPNDPLHGKPQNNGGSRTQNRPQTIHTGLYTKHIEELALTGLFEDSAGAIVPMTENQ